MQTFDQALFNLYENYAISYEEAIRNADSQNDLRLQVKLKSARRLSTGAGELEPAFTLSRF
jgi:twitching motility protein PilU